MTIPIYHQYEHKQLQIQSYSNMPNSSEKQWMWEASELVLLQGKAFIRLISFSTLS